MEIESFKEYIEDVKNKYGDKFGTVLKFTRLMELKPGKSLFENIMHYLRQFYYRKDCQEWFQPDYERFIEFLEHYLKGQPAQDIFDERGYLDLTKTSHLLQPIRFAAGKGSFVDDYIMLTNGKIFISKKSLNYPVPAPIRVGNQYSIYCPLIASYIAKTIGVQAARFVLATQYKGDRILSENFLKPNEELVVYLEEKEDAVMISEQLRQLEEVLKLRRFPEDEIAKAKIEFLQQEFVAKIIGLKDQTHENSPIIISTDEEGKKHVKLAPMFDLDYSFHIGEEKPKFLTRKCDNGQTDIGSFIEQYKDYPGFEEFAKRSIQTINMRQIFAQIYEESGIKRFGDYESDEQIYKFCRKKSSTS